MMSYDRHDRIWEIDGRENVCADTGMQLHFFELARREWSGLVQNVFGDGKFTHVMKKRGCLNRLDLPAVIYAHGSRQTHREELNSSDVTMSNLVLRVDGHCQSLNRRNI